LRHALLKSCGFILFGASVLAACDADRAPSAIPTDASPSVDLDAMGARIVDTLVGAEAEALCREDARRLDPCLEVAVESTQTAEECDRFAEECHAKSRGEASASCAGINLGPAGTCSISVDEYFRCIDAWTSTLRCSEAGNAAFEPEICKPVVAKCERLAGRFSRAGRLLPCDPDSGAGQPPDTNDDIFGLDRCRLAPARLVILGDSIANCFLVEGAVCSPYLMAERLRGTVAPGVVLESFAVDGKRLGDIPAQARQVAPGPGHVFVWLFAIGNDILSGLLNRSEDLSPYHAALDEISAYFLDASRFPDGATFLLNTQYGPYDQCHPPGRDGSSPERGEQLRALNTALFLDRAVARADTVAVDHYADWLGHGVNANIRGCPHCGIDNTSWMADTLHPNALGHGHIAEKWRVAFDQMFAPECGQQLR
jgi:hypothetical protein